MSCFDPRRFLDSLLKPWPVFSTQKRLGGLLSKEIQVLNLPNSGDMSRSIASLKPNILTFSPLKMDAWNTSFFPIGFRPIFRGKLAVSFREDSFSGFCCENRHAVFTKRMATRNPVNQIMVEIQNTYLSTGTKEVVHNHSNVFSLPMGSMGLVYSTQHLP